MDDDRNPDEETDAWDLPGPVRHDGRLGWWTISGEALLMALERAHRGENPDVVYAELYANSDHETAE